MSERPIIFSADMVRTILDGRKTMTRRVVKYRSYAEQDGIVHPHECPYGQPGDRLWVKESWWHHKECRPPFEHTGPQGCIRYTALEATHAVEPGRWLPEWYEKKSALFMPRWASRITLEITAVRVERVQDITEYDAKAEGAEIYPEVMYPDEALPEHPYRNGFFLLWNSLNTKHGYGWDANPWVWVISFRRIQP